MLKLFENNLLFKECIESLDKNVSILSFGESKKIYSLFERVFPIGFSSIDWKKVPNNVTFEMDFPEQIVSGIKKLLEKTNFDKEIFVLWDSAGIPILKTDLDSVINHIDDVTCVSSKIWFLNVSLEYVVEWKFGDKTIGLASPERIDLGEKWKKFLDVIDNNLSILSRDRSEGAFKLLKNKFGFKNVIVDWNIIPSKTALTSETEIITSLTKLLSYSLDESVYLLWGDKELPVLKTNLDLIILNWNKMLKLSNKIWIFNETAQYIIEVQNNSILIGVPPVNRNINK